jgi:hypothetical protein
VVALWIAYAHHDDWLEAERRLHESWRGD